MSGGCFPGVSGRFNQNILTQCPSNQRLSTPLNMMYRVLDMPKLDSVRVNLKLPAIGSIQGTWKPDESEVKAAWELYVELVTRSPLGDVPSYQGSVSETLSSIYSLFDTTRGILKEYGPSIARPRSFGELSFGYFAVSMLNRILRPLLTEWHNTLQEWERENPGQCEGAWPDRCEFWEALNETREQLREYAGLFAEVAEVPELLGEAYNSKSKP